MAAVRVVTMPWELRLAMVEEIVGALLADVRALQEAAAITADKRAVRSEVETGRVETQKRRQKRTARELRD